MENKLKETIQFIKQKIPLVPKVGIVLGSGLGDFVDQLTEKIVISYEDIPHFKKTTVFGHDGKLILGKVNQTPVLAMQGRFHAYEGYSYDEVVFPSRVMALMGVKCVILTNAAGSVNLDYHPGQLVLIKDHINLSGGNPLIGKNIDSFGPRFPDMSDTYSLAARKVILEASKKLKHFIHEGVYAGMMGPTYETPAEIKMVRLLGGDMVGMSTVPEAIALNHMGIKVVGISCITNYGSGIKEEKLSHDDIKVEAQKAMKQFTELLIQSIPQLENV